MCAIAGILDLRYTDATVETMLDTMRRRGPDEKGVHHEPQCCLLHSRLSIIDPDSGKQPMSLDWRNERYTIVYNGELYNTEEIRSALRTLGHIFIGHSDTEVLLHAYAQWGEYCLEKLNGIYAFSVWEARKRRLFLARDRIGVKPLFYTAFNHGFLFASEMKTILSYPDVKAVMDSNGIAELVLLGPGRTPGFGVFKNIMELEPGCCGYYQKGFFAWHRYWNLKDRIHTDDFEETAAYVRYLVEDSIERQMISDVPIGAFLSGGLDSSIICAVCANRLREKGEQLKTFSVDYENNEKFFQPGKFQPNADNTYIQIMQEHITSEHSTTILSPYDLINSLESATNARDLPGMADVDFSLLEFCKEIRKSVKVALSGECADEIFGGYPWFRDPEIAMKDGFPWSQNIDERSGFLHPDVRKYVKPRDYVMERYYQTIDECDILPENSPIDKRMKQMTYLNQRWFMQTLLDRKDRMSMYHGLEVRVPFCDHRIAEYLYAVPWSFKDHGNREKGLLRYAVESLLPREIIYRKKSPYPKTYDPLYMQLVSEQLNSVIADNTSPILQIISKEKLQNLLIAEYTWPWYGQLMKVPQTIAYMLQINHWLKTYQVTVEI